MNKIILELENQEITELGVEAIIAFYRTMAIDQFHLPDLNVFATGVDSSSLNVVIDTKKKNKLSLDVINQIADFFNNHQVPWA